MPFSSGGGNSSGGTHSGQSSYHSNNHRGRYGGGRSFSPRVSRRPFRNSRRFIYYDRLGSQRFIYSTCMPKPVSRASLIFILVFMIPFISSGIFVTKTAYQQLKTPTAMTQNYVPTTEYITDNLHIIDNSSKLKQTLKAFEEKTGICPYVMTVYDSEWKGKYTDLESYTFSLYVNTFDDEQHLLIVYSEPENAFILSKVYWSWEVMQGNDTASIITEGKFQRLQNDLQRYFTMRKLSVGEAIDQALTNSLDYIMKNDSAKEGRFMMIMFAVIWNIITWTIVITQVRAYIIGKREYTESPMYDGVNDGT